MNENKHTRDELKMLQALPLDAKILKTQQRIREWYYAWDGMVYVSFSGGKDSTVLLDLVRELYPDVPAVFLDTGLEYPEIKEFVKSKENVTILRPKMSFRQVIEKYGYPVVSKEVASSVAYAKKGKRWAINQFEGSTSNGDFSRFKTDRYVRWKYLVDAPFKISDQCCAIMKKSPNKHYAKETGRKQFVGTMTEESVLREQNWLKNGCNSFDQKEPQSRPMSFWTEQDVLEYIVTKKLPYASVYGEIKKKGREYYTTGAERTGCVFCAFGAHLEKEPNRFQRLRLIHPKLFEYCMKPWDEGGLGMKEVLDYIGIEYSNGLLDLLEEEE